nr:PREDICTED: transmembrane protein 186 [Latimeria chalumnae]|eukprot:XP_006014310.1 PREDICTED: transmembrane protein 186 [Latimeria chalumnae]
MVCRVWFQSSCAKSYSSASPLEVKKSTNSYEASCFRTCTSRQLQTEVQSSTDLLKVYTEAVWIQHRNLFTKSQYYMEQKQLEEKNAAQFMLIYKFPAIRFLRTLSRLKLFQTGITIAILPPIYYMYLQGDLPYSLVSYATGIAVFAAVMLYSLSFYLRRFIGMMYLDSCGTTLKVSHLTFWGRRHDLCIPVKDVMTLGDTGDSKNEVLLQFKRYSRPDVLYFSTRLGQIMDKQKFQQVFGTLP